MSFDFSQNDNETLLNSLKLRDIIESLTIDDVAKFLESLGVQVNRFDNYLVCPTICHNPLEEAESMKLYWYHDNKIFHCYTECNESMSIFELYRRYMSLNQYDITLEEAEQYVKQFLTNIKIKETKKESFLSLNKEKYSLDNGIQILDAYPESTLTYFTKYYHPLWIKEGIPKESMDKFKICFSLAQNKIIIPHFDFQGRLVGIRGRALEEEDIKEGKYKPIKIGDTLYAHQLQFNLYGLFQHQDAIKRFRRAVVFEGEKSTIKNDAIYGDDSVAVACCGSNLNKYQVALLIKLFGVNEIVIAFDKEYEKLGTKEAKKYKEKLVNMCDKYKHLASFSYIFDEKNLLQQKDSPIDRGKEIYEELYKRRIKVRW